MDVRKEINFCRKVGVNIIGVIENMSGFVCPKCDKCSTIFAPSTGGAKAMCENMDIPFLGSIPIDPRIGRRALAAPRYDNLTEVDELEGKACDEGKSFVEEVPESPATKAYIDITTRTSDCSASS